MSIAVLPLPASGGETILAAVAPVLCSGSCVNIPVASLFVLKGERSQTSTKTSMHLLFQNALFGFASPQIRAVHQSHQRQNEHMEADLRNVSLGVVDAIVFHLCMMLLYFHLRGAKSRAWISRGL